MTKMTKMTTHHINIQLFRFKYSFSSEAFRVCNILQKLEKVVFLRLCTRKKFL